MQISKTVITVIMSQQLALAIGGSYLQIFQLQLFCALNNRRSHWTVQQAHVWTSPVLWPKERHICPEGLKLNAFSSIASAEKLQKYTEIAKS